MTVIKERRYSLSVVMAQELLMSIFCALPAPHRELITNLLAPLGRFVASRTGENGNYGGKETTQQIVFLSVRYDMYTSFVHTSLNYARIPRSFELHSHDLFYILQQCLEEKLIDDDEKEEKEDYYYFYLITHYRLPRKTLEGSSLFQSRRTLEEDATVATRNGIRNVLSGCRSALLSRSFAILANVSLLFSLLLILVALVVIVIGRILLVPIFLGIHHVVIL